MRMIRIRSCYSIPLLCVLSVRIYQVLFNMYVPDMHSSATKDVRTSYSIIYVRKRYPRNGCTHTFFTAYQYKYS